MNSPNPTVLVVGDLMLDIYITGEVERSSPEANSPVLNATNERHFLGGAANTALNVSRLGGEALVVGVAGEDSNSRQLAELLAKNNISADHLIISKEIPTTTKTRVLEKKHLLRIDREKIFENKTLAEELEKKALAALPKANIVLFSDYGKGVVTKDLFEKIMSAGKKFGKQVVVNAKPRKNSFYHDTDLIMVNEKEARELLEKISGSAPENLSELGKQLEKACRSSILITQGEKGLSLFSSSHEFFIPALAEKVADVSGAGDAVAAAIAFHLASGSSLFSSCVKAAMAAATAVEQPFTSPASKERLTEQRKNNASKIKTLAELKQLRQEKLAGKKIVFTNGIFDLFSQGHFNTLKAAKAKGDVLVVALNSDKSVEAIKGKKPFLSAEERKELLSALPEIDFIVEFDEEKVTGILEELKPDVFVKGKTYSLETIDLEEKKALAELGSEIGLVEGQIKESLGIKEELTNLSGKINLFSQELINAFKNKKKVLVCGNGGSASDAQHFQAELIGRFKKNRKGLPCIALTQHPSLLTALSNDFGFEAVFEKQVEALGQEGDVLVALSTSGCSENIIKALAKAKEIGMKTIGLSGNEGGAMKDYTDLNLVVSSKASARIQEAHITIIHIVSEIVEKAMFPESELK